MYRRIDAHMAQGDHTHSCAHIFILSTYVLNIVTIDPRVWLGLQPRGGKDAARAFATGCFKEHQTHDIRGLDEDELQVRGCSFTYSVSSRFNLYELHSLLICDHSV